MGHVLEPAPTGRAKCRGCNERIAAGQIRFGERVPNPFADGETTHWFHPECAAYKRPEPFLETLGTEAGALEDAERLRSEAERGIAHRRLPRLDGAGRAPSGRALCRSCREKIDKGAWRIALVFYENGRFDPGGFLHVRCAPAYFETAEVLDRVRRFSAGLGEDDLEELGRELAAASGT